jgi:hypothetical protein
LVTVEGINVLPIRVTVVVVSDVDIERIVEERVSKWVSVIVKLDRTV